MIICPLMSNPTVAQEFNELKSALVAADPGKGVAMAYLVWSLNGGNAIDKAPNGAESLLFKSLLEYYEGDRAKAIVAKSKTYTTSFLKWFGNWTGEENALPEYERSEVSKVVDENGEPLVVYHGSEENWDTYDENKFKKDLFGRGIYLTESINDAIEYGNVRPFYVSTKNPFFAGFMYDDNGNPSIRTRSAGLLFNSDRIDKTDYVKELNKYINGPDANEIGNELTKSDAVIVSYKNPYYKYGEIVIPSSTQIKHVENLGTFNPNDHNIYHNIRSIDSSNEIREELLLAGAIKKVHDGYELINQPWAIQKMHDVCKKYGVLASPYKTSTGRMKVNFVTHEKSLFKLSSDEIPETLRLDPTTSTIEELTKEGIAITELVSFLLEKFPQLRVEYITQKQLNEKEFEGVDKNTNSFVKGDTVYLIRGRVTSEIAAEELLHPLVYTIANQNWLLFLDFISEAKKQFPKLAAQIEDRYTDARGFNDFNRQLELVTQVLARHVNKKFKAGEKGNKLSQIILKVFNYIGSMMKQFIGKFRGNDGDFEDIRNISLSQLADIILSDDAKFKVYTTDEIYHSLSARLQAAQDEANRLIVRMNVLYNQYEKIKSKTPSQERLANQIFETLNRLKQHRDISAIGIALELARLTLGQYDESTGGPVNTSSIYKYLYDAKATDYAGVSPQALVDMYRNSIKFYKDLIDNIPSDLLIDLTEDDKRGIEQLKSLIENHILPLWTLAIMIAGDRIVDEQVDSEVASSDENKEEMKKVAKDWLHKNLMYGDLNAVTSYVYNYSYSSNPIIKQAFHLIQGAEQKTLEEIHHIAPKLVAAYQKANKGTRSFTPGWQSMMMEYDKDGIPTGNFVRDLNYGQYQKDLKLFLDELNNEFMSKYGFTYVVDDTGAISNSLTGEFAEDEEWGPSGKMPKYIEYLRKIEKFKAPRIHRRYVLDYYMERLSKPYNGTIDPMSPEFKGTKFDHGLSPKTLSRYTYYQSNINYYLNKCQDQETGLVYPERLSYDDLLSLDRWKSRMEQFTSIFNLDGSYKSGEDLKMAYEVRAWQKWIGEQSDSDVLQDKFNEELARIKAEATSTGNPRLYNDFVRSFIIFNNCF